MKFLTKINRATDLRISLRALKNTQTSRVNGNHSLVTTRKEELKVEKLFEKPIKKLRNQNGSRELLFQQT